MNKVDQQNEIEQLMNQFEKEVLHLKKSNLRKALLIKELEEMIELQV